MSTSNKYKAGQVVRHRESGVCLVLRKRLTSCKGGWLVESECMDLVYEYEIRPLNKRERGESA
jgi:hypothetical protein